MLANLWGVVFLCHFNLHFINSRKVEHVFICLLATCCFIFLFKNILKYILFIMLLQGSHFPPPPLHSLLPCTTPPSFLAPQLSSCPWVLHVSSLASPFPILFLTSPRLFSTYHLCFLFPVPFPHSLPTLSPLITLHVISISVNLFLFYLFA